MSAHPTHIQQVVVLLVVTLVVTALAPVMPSPPRILTQPMQVGCCKPPCLTLPHRVWALPTTPRFSPPPSHPLRLGVVSLLITKPRLLLGVLSPLHPPHKPQTTPTPAHNNTTTITTTITTHMGTTCIIAPSPKPPTPATTAPLSSPTPHANHRTTMTLAGWNKLAHWLLET